MADNADHISLERGLVELLPLLAKRDRRVGSILTTSLADREHQFQEFFLNRRRQMPDHAEVEKCNAPILGDKHVSRVRICVKKPVDQDLMEVGANQLLGEAVGICIDERHRVQCRDLRSMHVLHRQHSSAHVAVHRTRNDDPIEASEVIAQRSQMARLDVVVQLIHQCLAKFADHRSRIRSVSPSQYDGRRTPQSHPGRPNPRSLVRRCRGAAL